jgi:DNA-binding transcriptional LysR family regulator
VQPVTDARLATRVAFREELVIVSASRYPPIRSPRDLASSTILAFHPGCPHRARLEDWFDRHRVMPERIVEITSYHAMLGCAVAGMGIALMPRSVLDTYTERGQLGIHPLPGRFRAWLRCWYGERTRLRRASRRSRTC